ncbi:hypothetical protein HanRHA438_Chr16g0747971 [Helianthus annuus]|nr:hypothetical protein HanRHA438_Chr16g0747971 [Helianthus annuus]
MIYPDPSITKVYVWFSKWTRLKGRLVSYPYSLSSHILSPLSLRSHKSRFFSISYKSSRFLFIFLVLTNHQRINFHSFTDQHTNQAKVLQLVLKEHSTPAVKGTSASYWKGKGREYLKIGLDSIKSATENFAEKYFIGSGGYG